jgi:CDP-glycerol glycerophosphotransferase (TagB/SpsB family)
VSWRQAVFFYDPSDRDIAHLRDTLLHSDVVLNIASTITLEAIALDRPVVNLAYNPPESNWPVPIADYYRLAHYRPVTESGAVRLARSAQDLLAGINEALLHPELGRSERRRLYETLVTFTDGRSAERLADEIHRFVHFFGTSHGLRHAA